MLTYKEGIIDLSENIIKYANRIGRVIAMMALLNNKNYGIMLTASDQSFLYNGYRIYDDVLTDLPKPETRVVRRGGPFREEEGGRSVRPPYSVLARRMGPGGAGATRGRAPCKTRTRPESACAQSELCNRCTIIGANRIV